MTDRRHYVLSANTSLFALSAPDVVIALAQPPAPGTKPYREIKAFIAKVRKNTLPSQRMPADPLYRLEDHIRNLIANPSRHCLSAQVDRTNQDDPLLAVERALCEIAGAIKPTGVFRVEQEAYVNYCAGYDHGWPAIPSKQFLENERRISGYLLDASTIVSGLQTCAEIARGLRPSDIRRNLIIAAHSLVSGHLALYYSTLISAGPDKRLHVVLDNASPGQFKYKFFDRAIANPLGLEAADASIEAIAAPELQEAAE